MIYFVDKLDVIVQIIQKMIFVFLKFEFNSNFSKRSIFKKVFKIFIHFDIAMINAISYLRQARKSGHVINVIIMKNINKFLIRKKKSIQQRFCLRIYKGFKTYFFNYLLTIYRNIVFTITLFFC